MINNTKFVRSPKYIGGHAFSNGILLQGGDLSTLAVRAKSGEIILEKRPRRAVKCAKLKAPALRGIVNVFGDVISSAVFLKRAFALNKSLSVVRLFKNHGAEHKVIHCYENGEPLELENVKRQPTYHPRCGTSAAANMLIIEALLCLIIPPRIRQAFQGAVDIIVMLAAVGAGFETSRYAAEKSGKLARLLAFPGRIMQKATALEPTDDMIECAIAAAKGVMKSEAVK